MISNKQILLLTSLLIFAAASILFSLLSGSVDITLAEIAGSILSSESNLNSQVLQEIRIPRTLAAFVTGGLLALSGAIMQVLLRNPLADPYILGISGGAAVGALSAILLGASGFWLSNAAFAGALLSIFLVFGIANKFGDWSVTRLLLTGVVVSAGWGAVINILLTTSSTNNVQSMLFWLMGDLSQSRVNPRSLPLAYSRTGRRLTAESILECPYPGRVARRESGSQRTSTATPALLLSLCLYCNSGDDCRFRGLCRPHNSPYAALTGGSRPSVSDPFLHTARRKFSSIGRQPGQNHSGSTATPRRSGDSRHRSACSLS